MWVFNEGDDPDAGWMRFVERDWARDEADFRARLIRERADDEVYVGVVSLSKNQCRDF